MEEKKLFDSEVLTLTNKGEAYEIAFDILETLRNRDILVKVEEQPKKHFWERRKWIVRIGWYY